MRPHPRKTSATGWRIRKDRFTNNWEAYNRKWPQYRQFATWRRAVAYVESEVYGRHSWSATGLGGMVPRWPEPPQSDPRHTPRGDRWDAGWLLFPQRYVLGDGQLDSVPYTLTAEGWDESFPPHLVGSFVGVDCGLLTDL